MTDAVPQSSVARPFVKAVGGKTQLLDRLLPLFPKTIKRYYEPFVGGGAVFFALSCADSSEREGAVVQIAQAFESAKISDLNHELIDTYLAVRLYPEELIIALKEHKEQHDETYYYKIRSAQPGGRVHSAARFIYLNKTCYNGLYRVNLSGGFNVPFGHAKNPTIGDEQNIMACSTALQFTKITCESFSTSCSDAKPGDLVYFDPPYVQLNKSSFESYQAGGFGLDGHKNLATIFTQLAERGVAAVLSNSDTPLTRELYKKFEIISVQARRSVNSKASARGSVGEIIVRANCG